MFLEDIIKHVKAGKTVCCKTRAYQVVIDKLEQTFVRCVANNSYVGLTNRDGDLVENPNSFFILPTDMSEETAKRIQNFGEQGAFFRDWQMNAWRKVWEVEQATRNAWG